MARGLATGEEETAAVVTGIKVTAAAGMEKHRNKGKTEALGRTGTGDHGIYAGTAVKRESPLLFRNGREALWMRVNNC